jgi:hypothetical protein
MAETDKNNMSSSILPVSSGGTGATAAVLQAQAMQYSNDFNALSTAIGSGNLKDSQKALASFLKDSATATANGFDPVTQNATVSQDFESVQNSLGAGNVSGAQTAFATLQQDMQTAQGGAVGSDLQAMGSAVQSGNLGTAQNTLTAFAKDVALAATSGSNPLTPGSTLFTDIRSLQVAFQSGNTASAQNDLTAASQTAQAAGTGSVPTQFAEEEAVIGGLAGAPSLMDGGSMQVAASTSILRSLQTAGSTDDEDSTGFTVTPAMLNRY